MFMKIAISSRSVDLDVESWTFMNPTTALQWLETDPNIQCVLIEHDILRSNLNLFKLLQYRGNPCGETHGLHLYTIRSEEQMYLDLMNEVKLLGHEKMDRTNVGGRSLFGKSLRFCLKRNKIPLLTTKRVFFKGVAKELLWFLKGSSRNDSLRADGVRIWDGNGSREFLDRTGLQHYDEGELGPIYGYQWRSWGKPYNKEDTEQEHGIDQIKKIVNAIKTDPSDRRMVLSAWNVSQLDEMALPPCHIMAQFYVHTTNGRKHLSCSMYQRSADMFLGVPFNIASYALLTHMLAHVTGCEAHELVMFFGDVHLYNNHMIQADTQIARYEDLRPFPEIYINADKKDIDALVYEDLEVKGYQPCESIKAPMAV